MGPDISDHGLTLQLNHYWCDDFGVTCECAWNIKIKTLIEMFDLKNTIYEMKFKITKKTN